MRCVSLCLCYSCKQQTDCVFVCTRFKTGNDKFAPLMSGVQRAPGMAKAMYDSMASSLTGRLFHSYICTCDKTDRWQKSTLHRDDHSSLMLFCPPLTLSGLNMPMGASRDEGCVAFCALACLTAQLLFTPSSLLSDIKSTCDDCEVL